MESQSPSAAFPFQALLAPTTGDTTSPLLALEPRPTSEQKQGAAKLGAGHLGNTDFLAKIHNNLS